MRFYHFALSAAVLLVVLIHTDGICITKRNDWGQLGSLFTDPLCDAWCQVRICGKGVCRENPRRRNRAECICEKCYGLGDANENNYNNYNPDYNNGYQQPNSNYDATRTPTSDGRVDGNARSPSSYDSSYRGYNGNGGYNYQI